MIAIASTLRTSVLRNAARQHACRSFSQAETAASAKKSADTLILRLRSQVHCSIVKANAALEAAAAELRASANASEEEVLERAVAHLRKDFVESALAKAAKVAGRATKMGLVAVHANADASSAALLEVASETDFVGNSEPFGILAQQTATSIARSLQASASPFAPVDAAAALNLPLAQNSASASQSMFSNPTVKDAIVETIGKVHENIQMRRALVASQPTNASESQFSRIFGVYAHSGGANLASGLGRVGSIVSLSVKSDSAIDAEKRTKIAQLARKLAQHATGFAPHTLRAGIKPNPLSDADPSEIENPECALLSQPFLFGGGTVEEIVAKTASSLNVEINIEDFVRFAASS